MTDTKDIMISKKTRNIFLAILAVSLAVNLFIAGVLASFWVSGHRVQSRDYDRVERRIFRRISKIDRPAARKIMAAHHDIMRMKFANYITQRQALANALIDPDKSYEDISLAADELYKAGCTLSDGFRAITLDIIHDASPATRKAIARAVQRF